MFIIEGDGNAEKRLATVREYAEQERWNAAIGLLREVASSRPDGVIRVGGNRSLALARYCDIVLTQFPAEGIAAYRQDVDPQATTWLAEARRTGDIRTLERIIEQFFVSSAGDEALDLLAEHAWERGEISLARHYWTMLVPLSPAPEGVPAEPLAILRYPDTNLDLAGIRARLVMCAIALGEHERARHELAAFRRLHPEARGWLAGRDGPLSEILEGLLPRNSAANAIESDWIPRPLPHGTMTLGSHASRDGALAFDPTLALPRWSQSLPVSRYTTDPGRPALPILPPLSEYPVIWRDKVFVATAGEIHGFEQDSGRPAWSSDPGASSQIYPPAVGSSEKNADTTNFQPHAPRTGVPRHSLTVAGDRLFARLGPPLTSWPERAELRREETALVCLDLEHQGRIAWSLSGEAIGDQNERWSFEGPPIAVDGELFVLASRSRPRSMLQMVCLDADTGEIQWSEPVGTPLNLPPAGTAIMSHRLATYAAGRLYVATDQGAVVCMSAEDGHIEWVGWYESQPTGTSPPANVADRGLPAACLFAGGIIIVAPNDSEKIHAFDAFSGLPLWQRRIRGGGRQLLGARDSMLVVAGERLHGLDLATGQPRWTVGFESPPGFGAGRGLVGPRFAYWPTREDLFVVDWRTGRVDQRLRLEQVFGMAGGGNLAASPEGLFLAGPGRLVGFGAE